MAQRLVANPQVSSDDKACVPFTNAAAAVFQESRSLRIPLSDRASDPGDFLSVDRPSNQDPTDALGVPCSVHAFKVLNTDLDLPSLRSVQRNLPRAVYRMQLSTHLTRGSANHVRAPTVVRRGTPRKRRENATPGLNAGRQILDDLSDCCRGLAPLNSDHIIG